MGIPDHLTCLQRSLYASQEAKVRTGHGTTDWFQIGKGLCQGSPRTRWWTGRPGMLWSMGSQRVGYDWEIELNWTIYCHPAYLTYMQSTSCKMPGWMKHKMESYLLGEISITSDMQMTPPKGRKQRTNSILMKVKEESGKVDLKLNIQKTKIMASSPITSWQIDG